MHSIISLAPVKQRRPYTTVFTGCVVTCFVKLLECSWLILPFNSALFSGVLVDVTQNYGSAFYSCAVGMALSAVFLGLVRPAKRGLLCRKRNSKHQEDTHERNGDYEEQSARQEPHKRTDTAQECSKVDDNLDHNRMGATSDVQDVIRFAWAVNTLQV